MRSSPIASLLAMINVFLGGTAFGVGTIFGRKRLYEFLGVDHLFPYLDYTVYAIVGATGLFAVIVYIVCSISSGWNAKRCFEGTRATSCGRCLNATLLVCLVIAVTFWALVACLLSYPVMSSALVLYRDAGPARSVNSDDGLVRTARQVEEFAPALETDTYSASLTSPEPSFAFQPRNTRIVGLDVNPTEVIASYFKCEPGKIDWSYYGLYDMDGKPLMLDSTDLSTRIRTSLIFTSVAFLGALITMIGFLFLTCSVAMNFARLKELRYYEPSVNDDETIRLRH
ncbi:unnamed protein product [Mesocestoides corti]|uniref:Uncharacterized protein n=1 Tax=Mesocestoides corti TaxID=53468 RepID=A0A3P6GMY9_MESCO|nr:unnamed protein product [Mesocestoides corti]